MEEGEKDASLNLLVDEQQETRWLQRQEQEGGKAGHSIGLMEPFLLLLLANTRPSLTTPLRGEDGRKMTDPWEEQFTHRICLSASLSHGYCGGWFE